LSILESGDSGGGIDDQLPDADLFSDEVVPEYLEDIAFFLSTRACLETYSTTHKLYMVVRSTDYQLIMGKLYKLGLDSILMRCILDHERHDILWEFHSGVPGGHVGGRATAQKFFQDGLWWAMIFKYVEAYARSCDVFHRVGKPSRQDKLTL
jgi:hypothetical protein